LIIPSTRDTRLVHALLFSDGQFAALWCDSGRGSVVIFVKYSEEQAMGMLKEFKAFAIKGNVIDLAVGVIIGSAFAKIVDSLVQDMIMPVVSRLVGGLDFSNYYLPLNNQAAHLTLAEAKKAGAVFAYGNFMTILLNFLILAFIIFQMVRAINKAKRSEPAEEPSPAPTPEDIVLLREIRDSLRK
jgi:large conductance mechanosensitive channel